MNTMKTCLGIFVALFAINFSEAQTADEIISKHTDAIGGKEKISQVTSLYTESGTEVMGNEMATKTTVLSGKGYKNESDFNGQQVVQVVLDKGGWMINPFMGASDPTPMPDEQYKSSEDIIYTPDPLVNYAEHGAKVELVGQEKVGDVNAYKIKYTNKDNSEATYYIDPSTWYIIQSVKKQNAGGQDVTVTVTYADYKKTDFGITLPYSVNIDMEQFALKGTVKTIEVNKPVDASIFQMPGK
jgi:hypothetical protein